MIDTHTHLDDEQFANDLQETVDRAKAAGIESVFLPAIDAKSSRRVIDICKQYPQYAFPMIGLHPEEVKAGYPEQLDTIWHSLDEASSDVIAIGEVGLDFYWSREFEQEQLAAFEEQVRWSVKTRLPLMIHCRKAQNEMVKILRRYESQLPGGVFHCFTGNAIEAKELLSFDRFVLGIGGVLTFKKSHLPEVLPENVPLSRIVLETDSPYMAPVPMRGKRNEPAFVAYVLQRMAEAYNVTSAEVERQTNDNVKRVFAMLKH